MTVQQIVSPERIEGELLKIWETLAKENKMRASLFNLVVFNRLSKRTDYIRNIVQKVVEKFPCRTLFISEDSDSKLTYLKTAVSVVIPKAEEGTIACDQIDIGVAGTDVEKVPSLILPHLLPDLPIYVLWTEDPAQPHFLFDPLSRFATRMIFDSESASDLLDFAKKIISVRESKKVDVADLNWARTQGWRELITSVFDTPKRINELKAIANIQFTYNSRETESFCHLKIQSMYLLAWMASRLGWKISSAEKNLQFTFQSGTQEVKGSILSSEWEKLGSGTVISTEIATRNGLSCLAARIKDRYHFVNIRISSTEACELPYPFLLGQTATGQSLVQEICTKGTSQHYLDMLRCLILIDKDRLC